MHDSPRGNVGAPVFSIRPVVGTSTTSIKFKVIPGRAPRTRGEAAIGPATAKDVHVGIWDTGSVVSSDHRVKIVGEALFPSDVHAEFDEGLWLLPTQFDAVVPPIGPQGSIIDGRAAAVQFARGTVQNDIARLGSQLGQLAADVSPSSPPVELTNLQNVHTLPEVLAGFLGLVAVAALGSVLLSCAGCRSHEFAVLCALGMTRGHIRAVLHSQGTAIALFGIVVGMPLGIAVGRLGWRDIAQRVPLADIPPLALAVTLLLVPAVLIAANLLGLWPGRVALLHPPSEELGVE